MRFNLRRDTPNIYVSSEKSWTETKKGSAPLELQLKCKIEAEATKAEKIYIKVIQKTSNEVSRDVIFAEKIREIQSKAWT